MLVAEVLVLVFLGGAVDLANLHSLVVGEGRAQLVPGWGEPLAVAAPGSVELDKSQTCEQH